MRTQWTQDEYTRAYLFAAKAHKGQPWPGNPVLNYMVHISLVSMEVIAALQAEPDRDGDLAVKCALLHDVIEDSEVGYDEINSEFGLKAANGVMALSKNSNLNKNLKMADSLNRIRQQPYEIWMVKMADRIVNLMQPPESWSREKKTEYREEAVEIHDKLNQASAFLAARLAVKIQHYHRIEE